MNKKLNPTSKIYLALVVLFLYPLLECFHKRLVAGLVALHYLAHGFVDYYYMIVFVYYFHL